MKWTLLQSQFENFLWKAISVLYCYEINCPEISTIVYYLTRLQVYWVQLSGSSAPLDGSWGWNSWRCKWAGTLKMAHTQLAADARCHLGTTLGLADGAPTCDLSKWLCFSQCGSWVLRGSSPRGRKCKLPGLLKSQSGINTGYFHCILLVKQSQCHLRFKGGTNTSLWMRGKESNNLPEKIRE